MKLHPFYHLISLFTIVVFFSACTDDVDPRTLAYEFAEIPPSGISQIDLPIMISKVELQRLINDKLSGNLLENAKIEHDNFNDLVLQLYKEGNITLRYENNGFRLKIPIRFDLEGKFETSLLGQKLSQKIAVSLLADFDVFTNINIDANYALKSKSEVLGINWREKPMIKIGPVKISSENLIEKRIMELIPNLLNKLDESVIPSIDLKSPVEKVWNRIQEAQVIKTPFQDIYFSSNPDSLTLNNISGNNTWITLYTSIWANPTFSIYPIDKALAPLPYLRKGKKVGEKFQIEMRVELGYESLNEVFRNSLIDKDFIIEGNEVRIKEVEIFGAGNRLGVYVKLRGNTRGDFYFKGTPVYDSISTILSVDNIEFMIKEEDLLLKIGKWIYSDDFLTLLEDKLQLPVGDYLLDLPGIIESSVGKKEDFEKVKINVPEMQISPKYIIIGERSLFLAAKSFGKAHIEVRKF